MVYVKQVWENSPDQSSPVSAERLNKLETQYDEGVAYVNQALQPKADITYVDDRIAGIEGGYNRFVEGVSLYSYGHSYTIQPGPYSSPNGGEYQLRVGRRLGMGTVYSRGRSGTPAPDTFCRALSESFSTLSGVPGVWKPASRGVVLFQNYMNEAAATYGSNAKFQAMWLNTMRSTIALMNSSVIQTSTAATKTGTWTAFGSSTNRQIFANEDAVFSQASGAELSYTVTGDEVWVLATGSSDTYTLSNFSVICGSTTVATIAPNNIFATYTSTVIPAFTGNYWTNAYKVTGLNAAAGTSGSKTIRIRSLSASTNFQNGVMTPSEAPPAIFLAKEPTRATNPSDTGPATRFAANRAAYEAMVDQLVSEFPNVYAVDLEPGWDNSRFVGSLDTVHKFHPNDLGMQHIADRFEAAIKATITAPVNGVMVL